MARPARLGSPLSTVSPARCGDSTSSSSFVPNDAQASAEQPQEATVGRFPGRWEVGFQNENPRAANFWRRLAADVGANVRERLQPVPNKPHIPDDVILSFDVG